MARRRRIQEPNRDNLAAVPCEPQGPSRKRMIELTIIARKIAGQLDTAGLKYYEYCTFGEIIQRMLHLKER